MSARAGREPWKHWATRGEVPLYPASPGSLPLEVPQDSYVPGTPLDTLVQVTPISTNHYDWWQTPCFRDPPSETQLPCIAGEGVPRRKGQVAAQLSPHCY